MYGPFFVIAKRVLIRLRATPNRLRAYGMSCRLVRACSCNPVDLPLGRPVSLPQIEQHGRDPALRSVHTHSPWQFLLPTSQGTRVITSEMQML